MRRRFRLAAWCAFPALLLGSGAVGGTQSEDLHSDNIAQLATAPIDQGDGVPASGSDMAFQGNLLVAGSYDGVGFFRISPGAPFLKQLSFYPCPASQGDVSVLGRYIFVSVNSGSGNNGQSNICNNTNESTGKAGVRIVDISDIKQPRQVRFVETDCGSHTHTLLPGKSMSYIYVESYPLGTQSQTCSVVSHRKVSVIAFPTAHPEKAEVVSTPDVSPEIGCHDVGIFMPAKLAAVACIAESQIWDISDPESPVIISRIYNPSIEIHHSAAITWDGKRMVIGDEFAGSITGTCVGEQRGPIGAFWIYNIENPALPVLEGYYNVPRRALPETADEAGYMACTTHNFNLLPTRDGSYVASIGYRNAGLSVVDFSDPVAPQEIAYYLQLTEGNIPDVWGAYWYNGRIYANDNGALRGVSVYELDGYGIAQVRGFKTRLNPQVQIASFF